MIHTSRSKIVAPFYCPRFRYLKYHWEEKGLQRTSTKGPTLAGLMIHLANNLILSKGIEEGVKLALEAYEVDFNHNIPHSAVVLGEQKTMIESVARAFNRVRFPKMLDGYQVLDTEKELTLQLSEEIIYHSRMDVVLYSPELDLIKIVDYKPCSYPSVSWVKKWERDPQVLAYIEVAESIYQKRAEGMQIEGYVKGKRRFDKGVFGGEVKIQNSPLCYVYVRDGEISATYQRAKGWEKKPILEVFGSVKEYIEDFLSVEDVESLFFAPVPPIAPNPTRLASWRRQTIANELRIEADVTTVQFFKNYGALEDSLDKHFPQNFDACYKYGEDYPCEMEPICFNGQVFAEPLESGLFEERIDHHEIDGAEADGD